MAPPHLKLSSDAIVERSQKSLRSVKSFFEPCSARQVQKLFSSIHPFTPSPKTSTTPLATFHLFSQLPSEIREIIWTIYLSFPRVHILEPSASPTAQNPWPLNISTRQNPHPSVLICRESRALHHKLNWLRALQKMHVQTQTQTQIASQHSDLPTEISFISYPRDERVEWDNDIFWFKDIATVKKLSAGLANAQLTKYDNVRRIALDYNVLDYEEESRRWPTDLVWKRRFVHRWYGLVIVLSMFHNLDEVLFVLDVEGDVNEKDGETTFEDVDVDMRVRRRLERGNDEKRVEAGLRFPQVDDRALYPQAALDVVFRRLVLFHEPWKRPKLRYVYAKNVNP
ncbi:hypothetical protein CJF31_00002640 [Rutstroemia sp. NJR-2017a BVV2]|nr:hypothetical protein CJF31_00002640 [Rutstroemia sp. NJR-2017a BVV2]